MPREEAPYWTHETAKWIIFDLDGTLADITHRLHHIDSKSGRKDWHAFNSACTRDDPKADIISLLRMCKYYGKQIAVITGRDATYRKLTEDWFERTKVECDLLLMRPPKDYRPDIEVKKELFNSHLKVEDVWFVVEDREKVVEMWRSLGLTCLACQKGDY